MVYPIATKGSIAFAPLTRLGAYRARDMTIGAIFGNAVSIIARFTFQHINVAIAASGTGERFPLAGRIANLAWTAGIITTFGDGVAIITFLFIGHLTVAAVRALRLCPLTRLVASNTVARAVGARRAIVDALVTFFIVLGLK